MYFLDLHCSSEDEEADDDMMEEVKGEFGDLTMMDDGQTQVAAAAEAMMQLGSFPCFSGLSSGTSHNYGYLMGVTIGPPIRYPVICESLIIQFR